MRISTKIITGYAILIGIMAALVTYQAVSARRMQSIVANLSSTDFRAGRILLELMSDRDLIEEYAKKSFALKDSDYAGQVETSLRSFERELGELQDTRSGRRMELALRPDPEVLSGGRDVTALWQEIQRDLREYLHRPPDQWPAALPASLETRLAQLRVRLQRLHRATLAGIDSEVEFSRRMSLHTELVSLGAAFLALVLSLVISFLLVRSITRPLRQLTAGTRAVAEGKFQCRLEVSTDDEFAQVAQDFNSMTQRLRELDTLKRDFVSHVSHELKGPLASMQDNIKLLLDQLPGPLTEKQRRLLGLNLQSARRLSAMIFNLLDISRMEAGAMQYRMAAHDVAELVRGAVAEIESRASEQRLCVQVVETEPFMVDCDHDRMLQVLGNLLENAIKFSPHSGTIEVSTQKTREVPSGTPAGWRARLNPAQGGAEYAMITVADRGPGVPDEHKGLIFEKFHQISKTEKMAGQGVGLGLAIARTIVEAHGGAIWVEDNPRGGSRFVILLPSGEAEYRAGAVSPPI